MKEPIVIACGSKKKADIIYEKCTQLNLNARIKYYNVNSTPEDREGLKDVNKVWNEVDILIYTPTIMAGCSFDLSHFTRAFAYFTNLSVDYRSAIQMLGRVRDISTHEYHIFIKQTTAHYPVDKHEVEEMLRTVNGINNIDVAKLHEQLDNYVKFTNAVGQVDYKHKDLFYHTQVNNMVDIFESRNNFFEFFIGARKAMGAEVKTVSYVLEVDKEQCVKISAEDKVITHKLNNDHAEQIATAQLPHYEEVDKMMNAQHFIRVPVLAMWGLLYSFKIDSDSSNTTNVGTLGNMVNLCRLSTWTIRQSWL